jgi:fumarylacetoacetate (FAA) hydrolase
MKGGTRDGQVAVVARGLKIADIADGTAPTLQAVLDD